MSTVLIAADQLADAGGGLSIDSTTTRNLLRLVEFAGRHDLPIARVVEQSMIPPRRQRWRWRRMVDRLSQSDDDPAARQAIVSWLSPRESTALGVAQATGTLAEVGKAMMASPPASRLHRWRSEGGIRQIVRSLLGLLYLAGVLAFLGIMIFPTIDKMCDEFGIAYPMQWFFESAAGIGGWTFCLVIAAMALVIAWSLFRMVFAGRRFDNADVLSIVSINLRAGRPAAATIDALVGSLPTSSLRRRVVRCAAAIGRDSPPWSAMTDAGLIRPPLQTALELAPDRSAAAWLLATESALMRHRRVATTMWGWRIASWMIFAALASATLLICAAMFNFLSALIMGLS